MSTTNSTTHANKIPWLQIIPIILGILTFLFGGGYFYNNFINRPVLAYTLLENYDLGSQYFSGVVIENRGNQNQTSISLIISNLSSEIVAINFPGTHESLNITSGGISNNSVTIEMPRLSAGKSLSVYLISAQPMNLNDSNLLLSSLETVGQPSSEIVTVASIGTRTATTISILSAIFAIWNLITLWISINKRKEAEYDAMRKIMENMSELKTLDKSLDEAKKQVDETSEHFEILSSDREKLSQIFETMLATLQNDAKSIEETHGMIQQAVTMGKLKSSNKTGKILQLLENIQSKTNEKLQIIEGAVKISHDFFGDKDL